MALEKFPALVLTFNTNTDAMYFEDQGHEAGLKGRLIPVPRAISASCGLAWMSRLDEQEALEEFLRRPDILYAGRYELEL